MSFFADIKLSYVRQTGQGNSCRIVRCELDELIATYEAADPKEIEEMKIQAIVHSCGAG